MYIRVCLLLLVLLVSACGPVHKNVSLDSKAAKEVHVLAVQLKSKGDFEVFMDRGTATNGPAVMFGLVGAAVASSINQSEDSKKEERVSKYIKDIDHQLSVKNGLLEGLNQQTRFSVIKATPKNTDADGILELTIKDWGLKVTDKRRSLLVTPFVQLECVVRNKAGKRKLMDIHETFYGKNSRYFDRYENDGELLVDELQAILHRAGLQIGTRMAYTLGGES